MRKNTRPYLLIVSILIFSVSLHAQDLSSVQREIDKQVWAPFKAAYEALDAKTLNQIYAKEVLRVTPQGIDTENAFKKANLIRFNQRKKEGTVISLDFWFDSRKTNEHTSYEVGVFRITTITEGIESIIYGQFHIVVKKIKGTWKITQDWDTGTVNGKPLTADDFAYKTPAEF